jgi:hypothetical protein
MFNKKRLQISLILGALLGILCIIGVGLRLGFEGNQLLLLATWYNRVIMGLVIGLAGGIIVIKGKYNPLVRGLLLGLMVSLAWYLATGLRDIVGFGAGLAYGMAIDYLATRYS